ncbi:UNVERIFIED_CONTAM: hypothetical protein Slati_0933500 [Sesamum latifolium]|uniref:Uncharacterized protein n=1 Tax=Sesamum latifolium TaxID=2727402 RepID=A0AAW2XQ18_9LAMI
MFTKYFRDYAAGERGGSTPPARSPKGTPASSGSKGKRPMSPPAGVTSEGPSKRIRASSLGTPPTGSSKPSATPPPPPPIKEEKGVLFSAIPLFLGGGGLYVRSSFAQDEGEVSSMALSLMRGW